MLDKHKNKNNNRQECAHLIQSDEAKAELRQAMTNNTSIRL